MEQKETEVTTVTDIEASTVAKVLGAGKIAVYLKDDPGFDELVSALAFGNFLEINGKTVKIICSALPDYLKTIAGVEKIQPVVGNPSLVISFDYNEGDIEKISYKVDNGRFNLIINSKKGINPNKLSYQAQGVDFDLICFVGLTNSEINTLVESLPAISTIENLNDKQIIFAKTDQSVSEQMVAFMTSSNLKVDPKTGELLFSGIKSSSGNFADPSSPTAFEAAAQAIRWIKEETSEAPESWLAPKIYKGSTVVE